MAMVSDDDVTLHFSFYSIHSLISHLVKKEEAYLIVHTRLNKCIYKHK